MKRDRVHQPAAPAFTLIELLVVIAIIAILGSLLLHAVKKGKMQAMVGYDLNNQKQLAAGWSMYSDDNQNDLVGMNDETEQDWIVRPDLLNPAPNGPHGKGGGFPNVYPAASSDQDANVKWDMKGYQVGGLYSYVPNPEVIHCPADFRWRLLPPYFAYRSFAGSGGLDNLSRTTDIKHPSDRFLWMEENDPRGRWVNGRRLGENLGSWIFRENPNPDTNWEGLTWYDTPAVFHISSGTMSYADGHVENHRWLDEATLVLATYQAGWGGGDQAKAALALTVGLEESPRDLPYVASRYATQAWR